MPTFKLHGMLVYFAAWKKHIGLYPPVSCDKAIEKAVARYAGEKGNLQFPLHEPMPIALIGRIVKLRVKQDSAKAALKLTPAKLQSKSSASVAKGTSEYNDPEAVTTLLKSLNHPLKLVIECIRTTILKADSQITEGIKWNAPSFYCRGWFATFHLRAKTGIVLVLHHSSNVRSEAKLSQTIKDPNKLLKWASADRATITFASRADFQQKQASLKSIVQQWVESQVVLEDALDGVLFCSFGTAGCIEVCCGSVLPNCLAKSTSKRSISAWAGARGAIMGATCSLLGASAVRYVTCARPVCSPCLTSQLPHAVPQRGQFILPEIRLHVLRHHRVNLDLQLLAIVQ